MSVLITHKAAAGIKRPLMPKTSEYTLVQLARAAAAAQHTCLFELPHVGIHQRQSRPPVLPPLKRLRSRSMVALDVKLMQS